MKQRIITGLLIIAAALPPLILGGFPLQLLIIGVVCFGSYEIVNVLKLKKRFWMMTGLISLGVLISHYIPVETYTVFLTCFVIVLFLLSMMDEQLTIQSLAYLIMMTIIFSLAIRGIIHVYEYGGVMMIYIALACFGSDIGAYFFGVTFGKHKLIERVSPKKTWEGSLGGWITGFGLSLAFALWKEVLPFEYLLFFSLTLPLIGQLGDLSFSLVKRAYGVKDFASWFPGHGGVLDRIDSLLFCLMFSHAVLVVIEMVA